MNNLQQIEALLFISGDSGINESQLSDITGFSRPAIREIITSLNKKYASDESTALEILYAGDSYKLVTKKELSGLLTKYFEAPLQSRLSAAALEILTIIAYRQPITRVEIDQIRGVQSGGSIQNLVVRDLIEVTGRLEEPGRPKLYGTTSEFLDYFGLSKISDLPKLPDVKNSEEKINSGDLFLKEFNNQEDDN
ncbi:SMC-Scp complex subunit ScpB [Pediococcus claussenii]|uniref:Segregation and condensation protein B n=1 Tax=Pediococcus claussenii (strain ATCC BAA-344 / DSM 14800 / JCM 18046 / KCTC 3811 / LMG 21948 / P06) TaxID=701521 RepID=G8PD34_PEDCP|nr:SMC-Scp complex subunit ScpB [Pediococcus claussenii]AEV95169.1 segregation and condensation protein B [Pediococcus claussenii ATCC BAA-344]ANZ70402.1 SMC-Scp complex subunit ScpB [Pediococcus claussenii]ANZ72218.1 SMC-Scp complex subunit ScpB [Pediococcus claussenii]KRN19648.1 scpB protein [Pediococcus claussenii]